MSDDNPQFVPGMVIERQSLVIDVKGRAWWVDPHAQIIRDASQAFRGSAANGELVSEKTN